MRGSVFLPGLKTCSSWQLLRSGVLVNSLGVLEVGHYFWCFPEHFVKTILTNSFFYEENSIPFFPCFFFVSGGRNKDALLLVPMGSVPRSRTT